MQINRVRASFVNMQNSDGIQGRSQEFILTEARGLMASAGARAYKGGLGAEPPAGSRGRAPGQGVRGRSPPEAESFLLSGVQRTEQICTLCSIFSNPLQ